MKPLLQPRSFLKMGPAILGFAIALMLTGAVFAQSQLPGHQLTSESGHDLRPVWSPDGSQIAYFTDSNGSFDIWVMDGDGSNKRQLTDELADDRRPSWSPDGSWLTFDSDRSGNRDIWIMPAGGGEPIQVTDQLSNDNFPAWSPDGTRIAYFSYQGGQLSIWVVELGDILEGGSSSEPIQITNTVADENSSQCTYACHMPSWSPDNQQIAYTGNSHTEIWIVNADGSDAHELQFEEIHMHFPTWTSDGRLILLSEHNNVRNEPVNDVWIADADGSNASILFPNIPHGGPFYWNPGNLDMIAFHSPRSGNFNIYSVNLTEIDAMEVLPEPAEESQPADEQVEEMEAPTQPTATEVSEVAEAVPSAPEPEAPSALTLTPLRIAIVLGAGFFFLAGFAVIIYMLRKST